MTTTTTMNGGIDKKGDKVTQLQENIKDVISEVQRSINVFGPEQASTLEKTIEEHKQLSSSVAMLMSTIIKNKYPEIKYGKELNDYRYKMLSHLLGREITSTYELYVAEAGALQDFLQSDGNVDELFEGLEAPGETGDLRK